MATIRIFVWLENVPGPLASPGLKSPVSIMACRQAPIFRLSPKIVGEKLETSLVRMGTGLFHIGSTGNPEIRKISMNIIGNFSGILLMGKVKFTDLHNNWGLLEEVHEK
ncbi:MAG: hypothetical protein E7L01_23145 [Paenibacillus macerans]|uniref:hypothetical protein n=1 Tax=Paenibacillus macerans TaxID=44252 RepID=UPI00291137A2|nr:hypothetical protein [Paenibacillus macerans]MDU7476210.1 hypothetical protein [Paenibacillus macerans]